MCCAGYRRCWFVLAISACLPVPLSAQSVSFLTQRVFVTGFTPVIGRGGGVGGVEVDAGGVLQRAETDTGQGLTQLRDDAAHGVSDDLRQPSPIRKVSLRKLEYRIAQLAADRQPLTADILFLAGLQRIEYVLVYPQQGDLVIAGPAEGWTRRGTEMVGSSSGRPVLRLDDLLDALQGTALAIEGEGGISCSIDPDPEGMTRVQQMFRRRRVQVNEALLQAMQRELGDQDVSITGVRPESHFARVIVGADYWMKRIAMGLDQAPVADLPSYLQLMQRGPAAGQMMAPRWWLATDYATVERSEDGLAWHFQGRGVKVMSEDGYLNDRGQLVQARRANPLAQLWADKFTDAYDQLAASMSIFGQLQGCVDLAVVAALITHESLLDGAECPLSMLTDSGRITGEELAVPKFVPSLATAVRGRRGWVLSVSGGVDLDTWNVLAKVRTNPKLSVLRDDASRRDEAPSWWWD